MMRLVENDARVRSDHASPLPVIGEKQRVVDEEDLGLAGPPPRADQGAPVREGAGVHRAARRRRDGGRPGASFRALPGLPRAVVREREVNREGEGGPRTIFHEGCRVRQDAPRAEIVLPAEEPLRAHAGDDRLEERRLLAVELILEILRVGRDDDPLAGFAREERRRHEIAERFPRARACLDEREGAPAKRPVDCAGHVELPASLLPERLEYLREGLFEAGRTPRARAAIAAFGGLARPAAGEVRGFLEDGGERRAAALGEGEEISGGHGTVGDAESDLAGVRSSSAGRRRIPVGFEKREERPRARLGDCAVPGGCPGAPSHAAHPYSRAARRSLLFLVPRIAQ